MAEANGAANVLAELLDSDSSMKIAEKLGYTRDEVLQMSILQVRDLINEVEQYVD